MRLDPSSIRVSRWTAALVLGAASLFGGMAVAAQDVVVTPPPEPAATAEEGRLQAIFMDVQGRVRWRATENSPWQTAKVNALVDPGSQIQTSLNSRATLRVGKNASVLMDPGSDLVLPEVAKDGETLRTVASVRAGRVDFKVDKVGLTNDFKVVTPSTTLAVRGTAFAVSVGKLKGFEILGARTNGISAIELNYVLNNLRFFLSGGASSSVAQRDPVRAAWLNTLGPPAVAGTIVTAAEKEQQATQGDAGSQGQSQTGRNAPSDRGGGYHRPRRDHHHPDRAQLDSYGRSGPQRGRRRLRPGGRGARSGAGRRVPRPGAAEGRGG